MNDQVEMPQQSNEPLKFDEIDSVFEKEGHFTRFNILLHIWGFLVSLTICWNYVMTVFTGADPGWKCETNYTNQFCNKSSNESFFVDHESFNKRCEIPRNEWAYTTSKRYSFITEFDLICEKKVIAALVSSSYYIGGIVGAFFTGVIADYFGRKPVLISTLLTCSLAAFSGYYIKDIWQLIIVNIIAGGAQVSCFFTLYTYVLELVAPANHGVSNSVLQTGLVLSFLLIDMISFFVRDWRQIKLYSSFPCLLPFLISFAIPESPRWLLSKGKANKAKTILCKILNVNQSKQIIGYLAVPKEIKSKAYKELFRTLSLAALTISTAFVRFVAFAVCHILLFDTSYLGGDLYQSFALAAIPNIISCLTYPLYANRIGRRTALCVSLIMTAVLSCAMSVIPQSYHYKYDINITLLVIAIFFSIMAINTINTWVFEIFPTCLRARGMSISIMCERFGAFISPFVVRLLQGDHHKFSYVIVIGLCILAVALSYFVLPETRDRPTRESIEDFKGRIREEKNGNLHSFDNAAIEADVVRD